MSFTYATPCHKLQPDVQSIEVMFFITYFAARGRKRIIIKRQSAMEIVNIEAKTFETMLSKFESFV